MITYMRPDENIVRGGTVSGGAASTYDDDWLVDGRGRPAKASSGTIAWTITPSVTGEVGLVVVHSHNIEPTIPIAISGSVSASMSGPAARSNGIPVNPHGSPTPASTSSLVVTVTGNSAAVTIGEVLAGKKRTLAGGWLIDTFKWWYLEVGIIQPQNPVGSIPPFDRRLVARALSGDFYFSEAEKPDVEAWFEGSRNNSRPGVIIPFDSVQDAWVGTLISAEFHPVAQEYIGSVEFHEWVRKGW